MSFIHRPSPVGPVHGQAGSGKRNDVHHDAIAYALACLAGTDHRAERQHRVVVCMRTRNGVQFSTTWRETGRARDRREQ